ncbi:hypothetical protein HJC23_006438 [Cyclotella cryptica]|uniref:Peptidyl-prolyl cis-trans isomerase n=1 Tax=Cyclotella cryptica TaxID=29204 RepID=A0ABD3QUS2_9STRA|eukprot:CCRYP_001855-RA/>CCRYP_001855-RA protein AED:0.00 eAED:0.00 QI:207/-1/1/1/-1/1/1/270/290
MHHRLVCCIVGCSILPYAEAFARPFRQHGLVSQHSPVLAHSETSLTTHAHAAADNGDAVDASHLERRKFLTQSFVVALLPFVSADVALADDTNHNDDGTSTTNDTIDPSINLPKITSKVYLDIQYANFKQPKRIAIGLFGDVMPRTVDNFQHLCTNNDGPTYVGTSFYRVISDTSIQGGAIGKDVNTGKSGTSSFENGSPFDPDNFNILHTKRGLLSAVRNPNGSIDSRFFIQTEDDAGWADGRYAAFGIVLEEEGTGGMELVKKISRLEVKTPQNSPKEPVLIVGCGLL